MFVGPPAVPVLLVLVMPGPLPAPPIPAVDVPTVETSVLAVEPVGDRGVGTPTPIGCQYRPWLDPFHPYTHCHTWGHQLYLDAWGMPYFSVGFGRLGFYPSFPWGSYWGLDARYLHLGWGHVHGPHFAGSMGLEPPRPREERGLTPAKSFTVEKKGTPRVAAGRDGLELRPFLRRTGGADWTPIGIENPGVQTTRVAVATPPPTGADLQPSPPSRWSPTDGDRGPTQVAPVDPDGGSRTVRNAGSVAKVSVVPSAQPGPPTVIPTKRARPVEATWTRVSSSQLEAISRRASAFSTARNRVPPRTRIRPIDRAAAGWDLTRTGSRSSSSFGSRSARRGSIAPRSSGSSVGGRSVRSSSRGSTPSRTAKKRSERTSGKSGSTQVRKGGGDF